MTDIAIRVENLSKQYHIGQLHQRHDTLRDALAAGLGRFRRNAQPKTSDKDDTFWALKDVSFEVKRGEVVGIIGRNGAGKSTLLKILTRITEPTRGRAELHGRVGSLLEVGTGFHPELTGRENIYLSGTILGMKKNEIDRKFDEIVDFSGVEKFIDTPVKRYSSGMNVRLGFAVAAHLEPEILLVDEVLAVGDAAFQKKCLGKMEDVAKEGRTVLFVSHNMAAIRSLCPRGLLLDEGALTVDGPSQACIDSYIAVAGTACDSSWIRKETSLSPLVIQKLSVDLQGDQPNLLLNLEMMVLSKGEHKGAFVAVDISDNIGTTIMQVLPLAKPFINSEPGLHRIQLRVNLPPLIPGRYGLSGWVGSHNTETLDQVENCVSFVISTSPTKGRTYQHTVDHGYIVPEVEMDYSLVQGY